MNICGCLIHVPPKSADVTRKRIDAVDGAEVHAATDDGRLIVVVEDTHARLASETIMDLHQIPGVISVALTYHHFEDPAETRPRPGATEQMQSRRPLS